MRVTTFVLVSLLLASIAVAAPSARRPAPEIAGRTIDGKRVSLAEFRGRPVLVNVWSSW
jgi:hypothetical protein